MEQTLRMQTLPLKPSWDEAPDWAVALGYCHIEITQIFNEWCWLARADIIGFTHIELRPLEYQ